jgi:hypothetical protein
VTPLSEAQCLDIKAEIELSVAARYLTVRVCRDW